MNAINRILVVLDTYQETPATNDALPVEVDKALRFITDKTDGKILLLACGYEKFLHDSYYSFGDELREIREAHCKRIEEKLNAVAGLLLDKGVQVESKVVWAFPRFEQIAKEAVSFSADLVVQRTRPYAKIARTFLTNDSWQLVKYCPKPLLLVKDKRWQQEPVLLAAVDPVHAHYKPMQLDRKILDIAHSASKQLQGELHVVHAYAEVSHPFALPEKVLRAHRDAFNSLLMESNIPAESGHLLDESPVFAFQHLEDKINSDIIVMGALSRSRITDALIGNTAERVLDYLESDVLIVKPQSIS